MINGHGGNIREAALKIGENVNEINDMSSNLNPLGPPEGLFDHLKKKMNCLTSLPEADSGNVKKIFSEFYGIPETKVTSGNGTTQLIYIIPKALNSRKALVVGPVYSDYKDACEMHEVKCDFFINEYSQNFLPDYNLLCLKVSKYDTVFICNPNNPTGTFISREKITSLCRDNPSTIFVVDESYLPFLNDEKEVTVIREDYNNLIILNSMSKIFRIPGLRIGFLTASKEIIDKIDKYYLPWSMNSFAQEAVIYLLSDEGRTMNFIEKSRHYINKEKDYVLSELKDLSFLTPIEGHTPFIMSRLSDGVTAEKIYDFLLTKKILIRNCYNFKGLSSQYIRFSLKTRDVNEQLVEGLKAYT